MGCCLLLTGMHGRWTGGPAPPLSQTATGATNGRGDNPRRAGSELRRRIIPTRLFGHSNGRVKSLMPLRESAFEGYRNRMIQINAIARLSPTMTHGKTGSRQQSYQEHPFRSQRRPAGLDRLHRLVGCYRHSSSRSRRTAALSGFFVLSHDRDGPLRYGASIRSETMPSRPGGNGMDQASGKAQMFRVAMPSRDWELQNSW